ncbi:MAG: zinc-ribbon domain-containing protein [Victivallales bacterium]|nr:zinc-ribbon domain-containing protein [Victivallales bacterium]
MIKCPKCGADNMMNAIFCRQCGDKLDLAALKIEDQLGLDDNGGKAKKAQQKANQIVGAVLAFLILVLIAAVLIPPTGRLACEGDPSEVANGKLKNLQVPQEDGTVDITDQDLTDLLNKLYRLPKEDGEDTIKPSGISVLANDDGTIKVVMKSTVFGFLPMHTSFTCTPTVPNGQKGTVTFEDFSGVSIGWIPAFLPEDFTEPFVQPFRAPLDDKKSEFGKAKRNMLGITVTDSKISFKVAKRPPKKPKK